MQNLQKFSIQFYFSTFSSNKCLTAVFTELVYDNVENKKSLLIAFGQKTSIHFLAGSYFYLVAIY